jgi:hypothetical protein
VRLGDPSRIGTDAACSPSPHACAQPRRSTCGNTMPRGLATPASLQAMVLMFWPREACAFVPAAYGPVITNAEHHCCAQSSSGPTLICSSRTGHAPKSELRCSIYNNVYRLGAEAWHVPGRAHRAAAAHERGFHSGAVLLDELQKSFCRSADTIALMCCDLPQQTRLRARNLDVVRRLASSASPSQALASPERRQQ